MSFLQKILGRREGQSAPVAATGDPLVLIEQGNKLEDSGNPEGARSLYAQAVALAPGEARPHVNLGNALMTLGRAQEALESYRRAVELEPGYFAAHQNLGNVLLAMNRARDAVSAYRDALRLRADAPDAWTGLGCALEETGALDEAENSYRAALRCDPNFAGAVGNLADVLVRLHRGGEARELLLAALDRIPENLELRKRLAFLDRDWGDSEAAVAGLRKVLAAAPSDLETHSSLLFATLLLPDADLATVVSDHRRFGERLAATVQRLAPSNTRLPDRRLKVGFVSPDLRRHPVAVFIEPVLRHVDRGSFELHCYYTREQRDEITELLAALSDGWHDAARLDDDALARLVLADGIDVLFDLAGHTDGQRLGVFARKPAPLQFTWLGYLATTGLDSIDYRLCDRHTDPVGEAEARQVETPARLPDSQWCYSPLFELPRPAPLPRLTNGAWTFGSTNQLAKLNRQCLHAWARVLAAVPDSRLRVLGVNDPWIAQRLSREFTSLGIETRRLEFVDRLPLQEYLASYGAVDILLDSFPYNGATTTCDALIMGVPVATIAGDRSIARGGVSLLSTLGLQDWIAPSADALPDLVRRKTEDVAALASLRAALPTRMRASPLMDGPHFARNLETLLRDRWRRWCLQN